MIFIITYLFVLYNCYLLDFNLPYLKILIVLATLQTCKINDITINFYFYKFINFIFIKYFFILYSSIILFFLNFLPIKKIFIFWKPIFKKTSYFGYFLKK